MEPRLSCQLCRSSSAFSTCSSRSAQMWSSKSSISMRPAQAPQSSGMLPFCLLQGDPGSLSSQVQVMVGRLAEGFCRFNRARVVVPNAPSSFKAVIMCWVMT
ncbi:TPA: hypothetical protein ACH3X2_007433 [Trebouxia sp. C0005]